MKELSQSQRVLHWVIISLIAACYMLPQLQYFIRIQQLAVITFVYAIIFIVREDIKSFIVLRYSIPYILTMFLVGYSLDFKYGLFHPFLLMWNIIFPAILCSFVIRKDDAILNKLIILTTIILFLFVGYQTIGQFADNNMIARMMTSGDTDEDYKAEMMLLGVGGFGLSYCAGIYLLISLILFKKFSITKIEAAITVLLLVVSIYLAYNSMFTTLIIITTFTILFFFYINSNTASKKTLMIFLFLGLVFLLPMLLNLLSDLTADTPVGDHFKELHNKFYGANNIASERDQYSVQSISAFIESPIWGHNVSSGYYRYLSNNSHSTFWSTIIQTGLIGVISYFLCCLKAFKLNIADVDKDLYKQIYLPIILYYALLSFFNPSDFYEISWAVFLITPLLFSTYPVKK